MSLLAEVVRVDEIRYFWDAYGFEGGGQRDLVDCHSLKKDGSKEGNLGNCEVRSSNWRHFALRNSHFALFPTRLLYNLCEDNKTSGSTRKNIQLCPRRSSVLLGASVWCRGGND